MAKAFMDWMAWSTSGILLFGTSVGRETGGNNAPVGAVAVSCDGVKGEVVNDSGENIDGGRWMKVNVVSVDLLERLATVGDLWWMPCGEVGPRGDFEQPDMIAERADRLFRRSFPHNPHRASSPIRKARVSCVPVDILSLILLSLRFLPTSFQVN